MSSALAAEATPLRRSDRVPFDTAYPNILDYVFYAAMHLICLAALWTGVTWRDAGLCAVLYVTRMFGLTAGYHRYFAHRSFRTSRTVQFLFGLLGTLAVQKGVLWWASTHRHHHRYSDTELDLHSPMQRSFLYSHSGWFLDKENRRTDLAKVPDLARYPELVWLNRWDLLPIAVFAWLIERGFGWRGLVWGFFISTILIWHAIHSIGSFGHRFGGYRRFATADNSRNKWFLAIALLGEGWHNNHHFAPGSARSGFVWWEYDVTFWLLKVMERLGLVWDVRVPPRDVRRTTDPGRQVRAFVDPLFSSGLAVTVSAINSIAARLIAARRDGDLSADRFRYVETWTQRLYDYYDQLVSGAYVAFRDFKLWNAWHRLWMLGSLYGSAGLFEILGKHQRSGDPAVFDLFETEPYRGLQGIDFEPLRQLFAAAAREMDGVRTGVQSSDDAAQRIFALIGESGLSPTPWKLSTPSHRWAGALTAVPTTRVVAWGRYRAPAAVRQHYFRTGRGAGLAGDLSRMIGAEMRRGAAAVTGLAHDAVLSWNDEWRRAGSAPKAPPAENHAAEQPIIPPVGRTAEETTP